VLQLQAAAQPVLLLTLRRGVEQAAKARLAELPALARAVRSSAAGPPYGSLLRSPVRSALLQEGPLPEQEWRWVRQQARAALRLAAAMWAEAMPR